MKSSERFSILPFGEERTVLKSSSPALILKRLTKQMFSKTSTIVFFAAIFCLFYRFSNTCPNRNISSKQGPTIKTSILPSTSNFVPSFATTAADNEGLIFVKQMFNHSWSNYVKTAWGSDYANPVSGSGGSNFQSFGIPFTIIDSLDTLFMMGFMEEFNYAKKFIEDLDKSIYDKDSEINIFETTIRILGGYLSAYELSKEKIFLEHAVLIGDKILAAFTIGNNVLPSSKINLKTQTPVEISWSVGKSNLAEIGTNSIEFTMLSQLTNDTKYENAARLVLEHLQKNIKPTLPYRGLFPLFYQIADGTLENKDYHYAIGGYADSFYEYLLKINILKQTGIGITGLEMFSESAAQIRKTLIKRNEEGLAYVAKGYIGSLSNEFEHLTCFVGGMFALYVLSGRSTDIEGDTKTAIDITETCYEMYRRQQTGLSPESVDMSTKKLDPYGGSDHYNQRPEVLESIFFCYRLTKDAKYRRWAWEIMLAIEKITRVEFGYSGLTTINVTNGKYSFSDKQDSYFLAETLKYLYLIFESSDKYSLSEWVFNTEAHPVRIIK